jgi:two-component system, OmpR family, phosphate regulon sensor histidine kinase PhoR
VLLVAAYKMRINKLNIALLLGFVVIVGIVVLQFFLLRQAVQYEEKKFAQKVHVAFLEVASKLNVEGKTALPQTNPIEKVSKDYYIVNVNSKFEPASLNYYLKNEFEKFDIETDFEYGFYDCTKECMKYGDYISIANKTNAKHINFALAKNNMAYYFVVHFPQLNKYIYKQLNIWIIFSLVMLVVLVLYGYSAFTILQQKKYSELQKDFINNMTHEFKTPISSILIASNFLDKQEPILQDEKLKKYTELITQQAFKLNGHVEKILHLAKSDSKPLVLQKTMINLSQAIQSVVENILLKYPNAKITVDATEEYAIEADEFHFSNLVYNLLDNAVKYAIKESEILIRLKSVHKNIHLSFIDNGMGIPAKDLQNVLEKFYRVQHAKSNEVNGFGLGLFYVNRICKEHKWILSLKSIVDKGTEVTILIPTHGKEI